MKSKQKRRIIFITLSITYVIYLIICFKRLDKVSDTSYKASYNVPNDYLGLFKNDVLKNMNLVISFNSVKKNSIVHYLYLNEYYIYLYKLNTFGGINLQKAIKKNVLNDKIKNIYFNIEEHYSKTSEPNFSLTFCEDTFAPSNDIIINLDADSVMTTVSNDSVVCLYSVLNSFSLKYTPNGQVDIRVENKEFFHKIKLNILFYKKNNYCYFIIMSPNDNAIDIEKNKIFELIK